MTQTAVLVLGLAAERPCGPYEMLKVLARVNIRRWYPVSDASIYLAVRKLESEGYLEGRPVRDGNNPEKTVYSVTGKGSKALEAALLESIESGDSPREAIDIAILFLCHVPKEEALAALDRRIGALEEEISWSERLAGEMASDAAVPFIGRLMVRHNLLEKQARIATFRELRAAAGASPRWDYFVAKDIEAGRG